MNLNLYNWNIDDIRITLSGFQFRMMNFNRNKMIWYSRDEISKIANDDKSAYTKAYRNLMDQMDDREKLFAETMNDGFCKITSKKYYDDRDNKYLAGEIITLVYPDDNGKFKSAPRLILRVTQKDFHYNNEGWGIEESILIDCKNMGVEDIVLIDEYSNYKFTVKLKKYDLYGDDTPWAKKYLSLRQFDIYKYSDKIPFYQKFLRGMDLHENS